MVSRQRAHQLKYPEKTKARQAVHDAIRRGKLPRPETFTCFDCGHPAEEYDHYLGYSPELRLHVQAVCHRCHFLREPQRLNGLAAIHGWETDTDRL